MEKTVTVFPKMPRKGAVCYYEDDTVCDNLTEALVSIERTHSTWWDRFKWRLNIYRRSWLKAVWYRLKEWVN